MIEFSLSLFFNKLVAYTFLYWLPFYVATTRKEVKITTSVYRYVVPVQWNLRIKDTWGPEQVSFIQRCPLFGGYKCTSTIGK